MFSKHFSTFSIGIVAVIRHRTAPTLLFAPTKIWVVGTSTLLGMSEEASLWSYWLWWGNPPTDWSREQSCPRSEVTRCPRTPWSPHCPRGRCSHHQLSNWHLSRQSPPWPEGNLPLIVREEILICNSRHRRWVGILASWAEGISISL